MATRQCAVESQIPVDSNKYIALIFGSAQQCAVTRARSAQRDYSCDVVADDISGKPTINALISSTSRSRFDQAVLREFEEGYNLSLVTLGKPSRKSSIESPPRGSREAFGLAHACRKRRGRRLGSLARRRLGVAFAKATSAARMRQLRGVTLEVTDRRFAEAQGVYRRVRLTVRVGGTARHIFRRNPDMLGNARQHLRPDFVAVVEGKREIRRLGVRCEPDCRSVAT
jgi:hypothetical protein